VTGAVLNSEKRWRRVLLPSGEGGAQRRMRVARPTMSSMCRIVERAALTRRYRATLSQWERRAPKNRSRFFSGRPEPASSLSFRRLDFPELGHVWSQTAHTICDFEFQHLRCVSYCTSKRSKVGNGTALSFRALSWNSLSEKLVPCFCIYFSRTWSQPFQPAKYIGNWHDESCAR
jgi:hypothetical protein